MSYVEGIGKCLIAVFSVNREIGKCVLTIVFYAFFSCEIFGSPFADSNIATQRVDFDCENKTISNTVKGADRNMPGIPQIAPHIASDNKTTKAERLSESPIMRGCRKLPITNCQKLTPIKASIVKTYVS